MYAENAIGDTVQSSPPQGSIRPGWEAHLQLGFVCNNGKTVLKHRSHRGPLVVQRPFYPEDGVCHVYLLHPPGGVVAGDRLAIDIAVAKDSAALLTTPAAGKFYRSSGELARQSVSLSVAEGASLEWLPQETIVYEGARMKSDMQIVLDSCARFIGWEMLALGRPAALEGFSDGTAGLSWRIHRDGKPFYIERLQLDAEAYAARWGLNGHSACGTLFACPASLEVLETVRRLIGDQKGLGVTLIDDMLVCRGLDAGADRLRCFFQQVWAVIREGIVGRSAQPPRIWAT